jgi:hypothetical protein
MRLLEPYFLYAFLALAIPILIHLFSLQKHKTVYFSNVAFLKQINQKKSNLTKLQKLLLLLIRLLLLSAVILAFSEPYLSEKEESISDKQIVGIYIDNSFSMNATNDKGLLIEQAKNNARSILNAHKGRDEFIFISNELQGKHQRIIDYNDCLEAIDHTNIAAPVLNVKSVIDRWNALKQNEINTEAELYIISDFQKTSFPEGFHVKDTSFTTHLLPISSYPQTNLSIDTCYLESPSHSLGQQEWLYFEVSNASNENLENLTVKLIVNGKQKALTTLKVKANSSSNAKLNFSNHSTGTQEAFIELTDATIPFDNRLYFNFDVTEVNRVLSIYENASSTALSALFNDAIFDYQALEVGKLNLNKLSQQNLIILENVSNPTSGLINSLQVYTENGGNILIIPSKGMNTDSYHILANSLNIPTYTRLNSKRVKVSSLNKKHKLFKEVFEKQAKQTEFPSINQYYSIANTYSSSEENIMLLNTKEPFINSYTKGLGSIYLMCSPLNTAASNLEKHALFVPLLFNMAIQSSRAENIYYTLGKERTIILNEKGSTEQFRIQKGEYIDILPEVRTVDQRIQINIQNLIQEDGFFTLTNQEQQKTLSFNYNRQESNLSAWDIEELQSISEQYAHINLWQKEGLQLEDSLKENRSGTSLWHSFILLALALLIAESLLLKNWNKKAQIKLEN